MSDDATVLEGLEAWAAERAKADKVALLKSAAVALKAATPTWSAARPDDKRPLAAQRAVEVWARNPQSEFAEACATSAMDAESAAEEAGEGKEAAVARAAQHLGEAVFAADADQTDEVAEHVAAAVQELARVLDHDKLRVAIPTLPPAPAAPEKKAATPTFKTSGTAAALKTVGSNQAPEGEGKRQRIEQTERADGETHKALYALREAERWLVPDHLDLPDHALDLSQAERDEAIAAVKAGKKPPQDLRELVARKRADRQVASPSAVTATASPSPRKTIGDEGEPEAATSDPSPPQVISSTPPPIEAYRGRELLPVERREPELPEPSAGVRLIGLVWLVPFGLLTWLLASVTFGRELSEAIENQRLLLLLKALSVGVPGYPALLGLLALATGRQPSGRSLPLDPNPFAVPFEPWWYEGFATLAWREIKAVFARPVAYIVQFGFLSLNGILFYLLLQYYAGTESLAKDFELPASYWVVNNIMMWLALVLICPAITMRLLAEEAQLGTLESLLTSPVTHVQVVLAKFASAVVFLLALLLITSGYLAIIAQYSAEWDWGPVLGGYLGLALTGATFLSIGLFTSSITNSQIIAFIIAAVMLLLLWLGPQFLVSRVESDALTQILRHCHVVNHQEEMSKGVIHWRSLVFYVSTTTFFLFLSVRGLSSHTWR